MTHPHLVATTKCTLKLLAIHFSNTPWFVQLILLVFNLEIIGAMETDHRVKESIFPPTPTFHCHKQTDISDDNYPLFKRLKGQFLQLWVLVLLSFCLVKSRKVISRRNTPETWHQLAD